MTSVSYILLLWWHTMTSDDLWKTVYFVLWLESGVNYSEKSSVMQTGKWEMATCYIGAWGIKLEWVKSIDFENTLFLWHSASSKALPSKVYNLPKQCQLGNRYWHSGVYGRHLSFKHLQIPSSNRIMSIS